HRHALGEVHELLAQLAPSFGGGPKEGDPFDTVRLREAYNLLARMCKRLGITGRYSISALRGVTPMVSLALESAGDYERVVLLTGTDGEDLGPARKSFTLDEATYIRLLDVAGPPDNDRKDRQKKAEEARVFSARWDLWNKDSKL
ncbi:MAG: hypothetical protein JWR80_3853, partial [Bradyrhizobium sp.]|nr:hypothetical protein [Bradyrhizobium sp.]